MSDLDPDTALGLVDGARRSVAERVGRGGWAFDLAFAFMAAGVVGSWGLPPPYDIMGYAFSGAGLYVLAYLWARRTGLTIGGVSRGRAKRVSILIGLALAVGILLAAWCARHGPVWATVPVGVGAGVAGFIVSRGWRQIWLRDIERMA